VSSPDRTALLESFPAVHSDAWTALLDTVVTRGLTDVASFYCLNNALCAEAENGDVVVAAAALSRLAREAARCHGAESLVAVRIRANAGAFTGIAGDPEAARLVHEDIWQVWQDRQVPEFERNDLTRLSANLAHWRLVCGESGLADDQPSGEQDDLG